MRQSSTDRLTLSRTTLKRILIGNNILCHPMLYFSYYIYISQCIILRRVHTSSNGNLLPYRVRKPNHIFADRYDRYLWHMRALKDESSLVVWPLIVLFEMSLESLSRWNQSTFLVWRWIWGGGAADVAYDEGFDSSNFKFWGCLIVKHKHHLQPTFLVGLLQ